MKSLLNFINESLSNSALNNALKNHKDFLISSEDFNEEVINTIKSYDNVEIVYINDEFKPEDIADAGNPENGKILVYVLQNTEPKVLNALMPVVLQHEFNGNKLKDVAVILVADAEELPKPMLSRLK